MVQLIQYEHGVLQIKVFGTPPIRFNRCSSAVTGLQRLESYLGKSSALIQLMEERIMFQMMKMLVTTITEYTTHAIKP